MKFVLYSVVCYTVVYGQKRSPIQVPAVDEKYFVNLQQKYLDELQCVKKLDAIFKSKWTQDLDKISIKDLGSVEPVPNDRIPSKPMYNTYEQEWLMESGSTAKTIESCMRGLLPEVVPLMSQGEIDCLNSIFAFHMEEEFVHEEFFEESLKRQAKEQLPFRRFISFTDFVELMFQSRTPDAINSFHRSIYEHAEEYLTADQDRVDPTYLTEQQCEWKNARALRKIHDVDGRLNEFVRQVRDSVDQQLGNRLVKSWDVDTTLPRDRYLAWLQARHKMMPRIIEEVTRLRNQKKDAQWLCERATQLAWELSNVQSKILVSESKGYYFWISDWPTGLEVKNIAEKARGIEKAMEKIHDFRHSTLKTLADKYEDSNRCLTAFIHLIQNHRRFDIARAFVDGQFIYPEFYCKEDDSNPDAIATRFCKCVGSFCVHHGLAKFLKKDFLLMEGPNGTYSVVPSGLQLRYDYD